jgi:hypothetical protein
MKSPTDEQLQIAALWLENNEGEGEEGEACKAVAAWIEHQRSERKIKNTARKIGVTPARLRAKLAEKQIEL